MKKIFLISSLIAANVATGMAQGAYDALTMSMDEPVLGTARYSGMGGAMSAFGGNSSTIKDNPAGLGVYRKSDISLTPNLDIDNDGETNFNINNFDIILNFGKNHENKGQGYITSSFGIAYNRLRNFSRSTYTEGLQADNTPYTNQFTEDHGSGEWNFAYGMNISNMFFLGLGINATSLHYTQATLFNNNENSVDIDGSGWNIKVGTIIKPSDFMRISLAFQSPIWYNLTEDGLYPARDSSNVLITDEYGQVYTKYESKYDLQTPLKATAGLGFVIADKALVGIDYIYQDYSAMREKDDKGQFRDAKIIIDDEMQSTNTLRLGAEVQLGQGFALRAGYDYVSSPTKDLTEAKLAKKTILYSVSLPKEANYFTLGLGYAGKNFYTDLAYIHKSQKEDFYEWMDATAIKDPIHQTLNTNDIMLTLGLRF